MFVEIDQTGDHGVFFSSADKFQQTIIPKLKTSDCAYISGVRLISYKSQEEDELSSNWRADPNRVTLKKVLIFSLWVVGVITLIGVVMSTYTLTQLWGRVHLLLLSATIVGFAIGVNCIGWGLAENYWLDSGARRAKRIIESEKKLTKHFNRLTTACFDEVYHKYCYTASQGNSRLEALVRSRLLTPSEGDYLNSLFKLQSNSKATSEEKKMLELAKAAWSGQQTLFEIAKCNSVPRFDYLDAPRTDTPVREDPLVLIDQVLPKDEQLPGPTFVFLPKA